jgi:hypothetical protein
VLCRAKSLGTVGTHGTVAGFASKIGNKKQFLRQNGPKNDGFYIKKACILNSYKYVGVQSPSQVNIWHTGTNKFQFGDGVCQAEKAWHTGACRASPSGYLSILFI